MSVVDKIESLGFKMDIFKNCVELNDDNNELYFEETIGDTKISAVFNACVKFIEWYNNKNNLINN